MIKLCVLQTWNGRSSMLAQQRVKSMTKYLTLFWLALYLLGDICLYFRYV